MIWGILDSYGDTIPSRTNGIPFWEQVSQNRRLIFHLFEIPFVREKTSKLFQSVIFVQIPIFGQLQLPFGFKTDLLPTHCRQQVIYHLRTSNAVNVCFGKSYNFESFNFINVLMLNL